MEVEVEVEGDMARASGAGGINGSKAGGKGGG